MNTSVLPKDLMKIISLHNLYHSRWLIYISPAYHSGKKSNKEDEMMNWHGDGTGWMGGAGMIWMSLFWIVLIGLGIWLITSLTRRDRVSEKLESPRQILDRRLASGEIDATGYAQARRLIENRSADLGEKN